jgi:hypothetical protein
VDGNGIPLNCGVSAANAHDVTQLILLVATMKLVILRRNGEQKFPTRVLGDRAYDSEPHREILRFLGIDPVLAKRNTEHGSGLGTERYVVEQTIAAIHQNRRLKVRYEKRSDIHQAFLTLDCIKVCCNRLIEEK